MNITFFLTLLVLHGYNSVKCISEKPSGFTKATLNRTTFWSSRYGPPKDRASGRSVLWEGWSLLPVNNGLLWLIRWRRPCKDSSHCKAKGQKQKPWSRGHAKVGRGRRDLKGFPGRVESLPLIQMGSKPSNTVRPGQCTWGIRYGNSWIWGRSCVVPGCRNVLVCGAR